VEFIRMLLFANGYLFYLFLLLARYVPNVAKRIMRSM